ncbi:hypothetical protein FHS85_004976 [Rhodoligotrophos appendicifer]|uniref:hypothetical protein n=1 Tax=Rhodoligotrophos appendicifer TaxID=987056 RepID=UPI001FE39C7E|nr:hypothetical protein [Rhodoligotrophos appendicifer]
MEKADIPKVVGGVTAVVSGVAAAQDTTGLPGDIVSGADGILDKVDTAIGLASRFRGLHEAFAGLGQFIADNWWILSLPAGGLVWWAAMRITKARVEDHADGWNLGGVTMLLSLIPGGQVIGLALRLLFTGPVRYFTWAILIGSIAFITGARWMDGRWERWHAAERVRVVAEIKVVVEEAQSRLGTRISADRNRLKQLEEDAHEYRRQLAEKSGTLAKARDGEPETVERRVPIPGAKPGHAGRSSATQPLSRCAVDPCALDDDDARRRRNYR